MLRPKTFWERLTAGELLFEVLVAIGSAVVGTASALKSFRSTPPEKLEGWLSAGGSTLLLIVLLARAILRIGRRITSAFANHRVAA
jgi:hypothetical protein